MAELFHLFRSNIIYGSNLFNNNNYNIFLNSFQPVVTQRQAVCLAQRQAAQANPGRDNTSFTTAEYLF